METVNIKTLRAELAEYVQRVTQGEEIVVTRNSEPIMVLTPITKNIHFDLEAAADIRKSINGGKAVSENSVAEARALERS